jgi:hypothetical protein
MMDLSRHRSVETLGYFRDAEIFKEHAGRRSAVTGKPGIRFVLAGRARF